MLRTAFCAEAGATRLIDIRLTTPRAISRDIVRLCNRINKDQAPIYVRVVPDICAEEGECFANVDQKVNSSGGKMLVGWQVWEWVGVLAEAEFHAVWQQPDDSFLDITPKADGEQMILFLPDPSRPVGSIMTDNIRIPLTNDPNAVAYIEVSEAIFRCQCELAVAGSTQRDIASLAERREQLGRQLQTPSPRRDAQCYCGSGRKYRKCCGNSVR